MIESLDVEETIVALATSREQGFPRGIVRLSGSETPVILKRCLDPESISFVDQCRVPSQLKCKLSCEGLTTGIPVQLLYWPSERSYTRQVSAEIHAPGALPLLDAIVQQFCQQGARLARPGEFTLRAFLSGRMNLTEAEAVLGVIDAQDQHHLNRALNQLAGGLSRPLDASRTSLIQLLAHLEAGLDFVEEDIEFVSNDETLERIEGCLVELEKLKKQLMSREQAETGLRVVLFGQPNTGKSSLFNLLVKSFGEGKKEAIVSAQSGTTRDFIGAGITIGGREFSLLDTAGVDKDLSSEIGESDDEGKTDALYSNDEQPLRSGQQRSFSKVDESSVILFCLDASRPLTEWELKALNQNRQGQIICLNKSDLSSQLDFNKLANNPSPKVNLSVHQETGIEYLTQNLLAIAESEDSGESIPSTSIRCYTIVEEAMQALHSARSLALASISAEELIASEIRVALEAIGKIVGTVYTDDILDVVFQQFCIGK